MTSTTAMDEIEKSAQAHIDALEAATHWSSTSRRFKDALLAGIAALRSRPEVSEVTRQLIERDQKGREKYGTTLDRRDLAPAQWAQHMAEELMDAAGYALALKRELECAPAAAGVPEILDWLEEELSAIDTRHRGDPSYDHDAFWFKGRALEVIERAREIAKSFVPAAPEQRAVSEDVRRDAERYRWLRDEAICFPYDVEIESAWCVFGLNCSGSDPRPIEGRELDEAIDAARRFAETDAAMAAQPQGEEVDRGL